MATVKLGLKTLAGILAAAAIGGCASAAGPHAGLVAAPVSVHDPFPPPPVIVFVEAPAPPSASPAQRTTPLAKPTASNSALKTHEAQKTPTAETARLRTEAVARAR